ncbi:hypothetical protein VE01_07149 [Pseudogymnoascus verrucosus]|uniref:DUF6594 domain-containing protein n=1 Tax=Pseudogymnoascus verrucosus TaxID=342668 RepID=A0A1B8GE00_9PEZI|nr:uncharacterized protein VE01_07149 [Pseudogymnoascus verrucosus]OBT94061.1 hypothetical protein VE01_07149 [Pseudogymnoascus verrucosus]
MSNKATDDLATPAADSVTTPAEGNETNPAPIDETANLARADQMRETRACQEKFLRYQESFNDIIECLRKCNGDEPPDEKPNLMGEEVDPEGAELSPTPEAMTPEVITPEAITPEAITPESIAKKKMKELTDRSAILGLPTAIAESRLKELCCNKDGPEDMKFPVINLVELQRLNIYAIRKRLAEKAIAILDTTSLCDNEAWRIKGLMSDYCNALRDFDYMLQKENNEIERDPFYLMYSRWCDWAIMKPVVKKLYKSTTKTMMEAPRDYADPEMIGDARAWTKKRARDASFYKRFWFGLAGGLALIAPMLLILLHHDRVTALATASVATVFFAVTMAFYHEADASPLAPVGATAAYSAVLIVLVGTKL